jgi:hypothetical protein
MFSSSERAKNKRPALLYKFINVLPGLLIKHGDSYNTFCLLSTFLSLLKTNSPVLKKMRVSSPYTKFYNFVNSFTPRINLLEVGKAAKPIYIPLPPQKNNILRNNFLLNYLKISTQGFAKSSFSKRLAAFYKNSKKKTDALNKKVEFIYRATKQNKRRAEKAYKSRTKKKKVSNVIKKSKQFYL